MAAKDLNSTERAPMGAFGYKRTRTHIKNELHRRATVEKNVETYMPTVRLMSTVDMGILNDNKGEFNGYKFFCVGTHGYPDNDPTKILSDIFNVSTSQYPIVGYTFNNTGPKLIHADDGGNISDETLRGLSVPPVGIVSLKLSRNNNGRTSQIEGVIHVPSFAQYNLIDKYFLKPGLGVLCEVVNINHNINEQFDATPIPFIDPFVELNDSSPMGLLDDKEIPFAALESLLTKSYTTNGRYAAYFGRLGKYSVEVKNNEYTINFETVGVGDASQGIQLYETFTKTASIAANAGKLETTREAPFDIRKWFKPTETSQESPFLILLNKIMGAPDQPNKYSHGSTEISGLSKYKRHVYRYAPGDLQGAILKTFPNDLSAVTKIVGNYENPFFISWPFFVNVILNDPQLGIKRENNSIKTIQPLVDGTIVEPFITSTDEITVLTGKTTFIPYDFGSDYYSFNGYFEPLVGSHKRLRSVDASTMIIYNEAAQVCAEGGDATYNNFFAKDQDRKFTDALKVLGTFHRFGSINAGLLSHGVWLNSSLIINAFSEADTIHDAIQIILSNMNTASAGYWNLSLDFDEHYLNDFIVIDTNFLNRTSASAQDAYKNAHIFNKAFFSDDGKTLDGGSELLEMNFDMALHDALMAAALFSTDDTKVNDTSDKVSNLITSDNGKTITTYDVTRKKISPKTVVEGNPPIEQTGEITLSKYAMTELNIQGSSTLSFNSKSIEEWTTAKDAFQKRIDAINDPTTPESIALATDIGNLNTGIGLRQAAQSGGSTDVMPEDVMEKVKYLQVLFHDFEPLGNYMREKMLKTAKSDPNNNFSANAMMPIKITFSIPGIGGLRVGEIIRIARLPGIFTDAAFTILGIEDTIDSTTGWVTTIESKFLLKQMFEALPPPTIDEPCTAPKPTPSVTPKPEGTSKVTNPIVQVPQPPKDCPSPEMNAYLQKLSGSVNGTVLQQLPDVVCKYNINTPLRMSHFLAQCKQESAGFTATTENLNYSAQRLVAVFPRYFPTVESTTGYAGNPEKIANRVYANRLGNGPESSGDGYKYRGRGYIQLTGKTNYSAFGAAAKVDTLNNPDLVATTLPLDSAAWFWNSRSISPVADGGATDTVVTDVTKKVNGGLNGLSNRIAYFEQYYALL